MIQVSRPKEASDSPVGPASAPWRRDGLLSRTWGAKLVRFGADAKSHQESLGC